MSECGEHAVNRRDFLQTGAVAAAAATAVSVTATPGVAAGPQAPAQKPAAPLPRRTLGKTGVDVTILDQGTWRAPSSIDRLLRLAYNAGVRFVDTADCYGTEPAVARFLEALPEGGRKSLFLATKDHPKVPGDLVAMVDRRLEALRVDYLDLIYVHGLGGHQVDWPKSTEFKDAVEAIKKSGKARFVGFSTHDGTKAQQLLNAAEGGFVDVIMLAFQPIWHTKDSQLDRALDACHKAGIGLVSMKQISGIQDRVLKEAPNHVPTLKEKGLSAYGGLLHAIWTDERFTCSCVSMHNTDQLREGIHAARTFKPLSTAEIEGLRNAALAAGPTFCANCDGSCSRAGKTEARLGELSRLITYHDHYGARTDARRLYAEMEEQHRDWKGADLEAARQACHAHLDFAELLPRIDEHLA
jgi:predicted aldo/keto reductase-like oxidoreductase